jgi:hypothetical protein
MTNDSAPLSIRRPRPGAARPVRPAGEARGGGGGPGASLLCLSILSTLIIRSIVWRLVRETIEEGTFLPRRRRRAAGWRRWACESSSRIVRRARARPPARRPKVLRRPRGRAAAALPISHHETFSTTIQPPYSYTKGPISRRSRAAGGARLARGRRAVPAGQPADREGQRGAGSPGRVCL